MVRGPSADRRQAAGEERSWGRPEPCSGGLPLLVTGAHAYTRDVSSSRRSISQARKPPAARAGGQGLGIGAQLRTTLGFVSGAALVLLRTAPSRSLVVGGVDLSSVDLGRPFRVDFSVSPRASSEEKRTALHRVRSTLVLFNEQFPSWLCEPVVSVPEGRFVLQVTPFQDPAHRVARVLG